MSNTYDSPLDGDVKIVLEDEVDLNALAVKVAGLIRRQQLKQARGKGNAFGNWAQTKPKPKAVQPNTVQRIF